MRILSWVISLLIAIALLWRRFRSDGYTKSIESIDVHSRIFRLDNKKATSTEALKVHSSTLTLQYLYLRKAEIYIFRILVFDVRIHWFSIAYKLESIRIDPIAIEFVYRSSSIPWRRNSWMNFVFPESDSLQRNNCFRLWNHPSATQSFHHFRTKSLQSPKFSIWRERSALYLSKNPIRNLVNFQWMFNSFVINPIKSSSPSELDASSIKSAYF